MNNKSIKTNRAEKKAQLIHTCVAEYLGKNHQHLPVVLNGGYFPSKTTCLLYYELRFGTEVKNINEIHAQLIKIEPLARMHIAKNLDLRRTPHIRFQYHMDWVIE